MKTINFLTQRRGRQQRGGETPSETGIETKVNRTRTDQPCQHHPTPAARQGDNHAVPAEAAICKTKSSNSRAASSQNRMPAEAGISAVIPRSATPAVAPSAAPAHFTHLHHKGRRSNASHRVSLPAFSGMIAAAEPVAREYANRKGTAARAASDAVLGSSGSQPRERAHFSSFCDHDWIKQKDSSFVCWKCGATRRAEVSNFGFNQKKAERSFSTIIPFLHRKEADAR